MRRSFVVMAGLMLAACGGSPDGVESVPESPEATDDRVSVPAPGPSPEQSSLSESRESWAALKSENGSSYRYTANDSFSTGYRTLTTLEVRQDRVSRRTFTSETETGAPAASWTEEEGALGSHPDGAAPLTIDGVYAECASEVLTQDPGANYLTLTFHSNGLVETCSYFPKNCADDCAVGVRISSVEFTE